MFHISQKSSMCRVAELSQNSEKSSVTYLNGHITYISCCCCSHINSHNQVRGHRTGSSHSGAEEYPRENTHNQRWYTHILQLTQFMPPPETYKSEIGSQSTMCQVQAGAYVALLTPGETKYSDCHPSKTTTYISHVSIPAIFGFFLFLAETAVTNQTIDLSFLLPVAFVALVR